MNTNDRERWEVIVAALTAAGMTARLDETRYTETYRGRARHGVRYSVFHRRADGCTVEIDEKFYGSGKWAGYVVTRSDRDGIIRRETRTRDKATVIRDAIAMAKDGVS